MTKGQKIKISSLFLLQVTDASRATPALAASLAESVSSHLAAAASLTAGAGARVRPVPCKVYHL